MQIHFSVYGWMECSGVYCPITHECANIYIKAVPRSRHHITQPVRWLHMLESIHAVTWSPLLHVNSANVAYSRKQTFPRLWSIIITSHVVLQVT